jgi:8-oxo-dGTP pyrophosphatase MutT (NUDIX family)
MEEISAGGVVVKDGSVLLLKKYRGDWVLPKGRIERGESKEAAAVREVNEESGVNAVIRKYIGFAKYVYQRRDGESVQKTVHYYLMKPGRCDPQPQREEGFCDAVFFDPNKAMTLLRHDSERNMVRQALELIMQM